MILCVRYRLCLPILVRILSMRSNNITDRTLFHHSKWQQIRSVRSDVYWCIWIIQMYHVRQRRVRRRQPLRSVFLSERTSHIFSYTYYYTCHWSRVLFTRAISVIFVSIVLTQYYMSYSTYTGVVVCILQHERVCCKDVFNVPLFKN